MRRSLETLRWGARGINVNIALNLQNKTILFLVRVSVAQLLINAALAWNNFLACVYVCRAIVRTHSRVSSSSECASNYIFGKTLACDKAAHAAHFRRGRNKGDCLVSSSAYLLSLKWKSLIIIKPISWKWLAWWWLPQRHEMPGDITTSLVARVAQHMPTRRIAS